MVLSLFPNRRRRRHRLDVPLQELEEPPSFSDLMPDITVPIVTVVPPTEPEAEPARSTRSGRESNTGTPSLERVQQTIENNSTAEVPQFLESSHVSKSLDSSRFCSEELETMEPEAKIRRSTRLIENNNNLTFGVQSGVSREASLVHSSRKINDETKRMSKQRAPRQLSSENRVPIPNQSENTDCNALLNDTDSAKLLPKSTICLLSNSNSNQDEEEKVTRSLEARLEKLRNRNRKNLKEVSKHNVPTSTSPTEFASRSIQVTISEHSEKDLKLRRKKNTTVKPDCKDARTSTTGLDDYVKANRRKKSICVQIDLDKTTAFGSNSSKAFTSPNHQSNDINIDERFVNEEIDKNRACRIVDLDRTISFDGDLPENDRDALKCQKNNGKIERISEPEAENEKSEVPLENAVDSNEKTNSSEEPQANNINSKAQTEQLPKFRSRSLPIIVISSADNVTEDKPQQKGVEKVLIGRENLGKFSSDNKAKLEMPSKKNNHKVQRTAAGKNINSPETLRKNPPGLSGIVDKPPLTSLEIKQDILSSNLRVPGTVPANSPKKVSPEIPEEELIVPEVPKIVAGPSKQSIATITEEKHKSKIATKEWKSQPIRSNREPSPKSSSVGKDLILCSPNNTKYPNIRDASNNFAKPSRTLKVSKDRPVLDIRNIAERIRKKIERKRIIQNTIYRRINIIYEGLWEDFLQKYLPKKWETMKTEWFIRKAEKRLEEEQRGLGELDDEMELEVQRGTEQGAAKYFREFEEKEALEKEKRAGQLTKRKPEVKSEEDRRKSRRIRELSPQ